MQDSWDRQQIRYLRDYFRIGGKFLRFKNLTLILEILYSGFNVNLTGLSDAAEVESYVHKEYLLFNLIFER